jgi:hypothetical protein
MAQRRFGPTFGAGVVVLETETEKQIQPAPTGVTGYVGKLQKGMVGELIPAPTQPEFEKRCGSYFDGSEVPDCAFDFYNFGNGAGELFLIRVTDGTEVQSLEQIYSRHLGHGYYAGRLGDPTYSEVKQQLLTVKAKNGGRWAGRRKTLTGDMTIVSDLDETTLDTGLTMLEDEWVGATLALLGVTAQTYTVTSNDTAGVLTVEADSTMKTDLASGADPTNDEWTLDLDQEEILYPTSRAGTRKRLSLLWKDGEEDEDGLFGLEVYEDEEQVRDYPNLSLDPANKWYIVNVVNEDVSNHWIEITVDYTGSVTSDHRPATFYGEAKAWSSDTLTVQICHVRSVASTNDDVGWVGDFVMPATERVRKQQLVLTFTSASAFDVTTDEDHGADQQALPSGTVGTAWASPNNYTPGFTVFDGEDAWTTGDVITIDVLPLPVDQDGNGLLEGGYLYPDIASDKRDRIRIDDNTSDSITLVSAPETAPDEAAAASGSVDSGAIVFPLTIVATTNDVLEVIHSHWGIQTLTLTAGGYASAALLAAEINTQWQAASGSSGDIASDGGSNNVLLSIDDSGADTEVGYESFLRTTAATTLDGFTAGAPDEIVGTLGAEFRVQALTELRGGHDGAEPADADYTQHANLTSSLFNQIRGQNKGLVKLATPGVTSTTVQKAFLAYAEARNYQYRVEVPDTYESESDVIAYINDTIGRNDFGAVTFPSYAYVPNPVGEGTVLRTMTGTIHGREALVAQQYSGYHKAAAGVEVTLPNIVRLPTDEAVLNEELLNPQGVAVIKKVKGNFILWGDRTIALDPGWKWKHQREMMSHYENQMLEAFDWIVFMISDPITQAMAITALRGFFLPEWRKRALQGDKFEDGCKIKCDNAINTPATRAAGDLNCHITLWLADTVERFVLRIGKAGIFEDIAA